MGPATFLLDRVAEDMAERLHAVLREFAVAADIGTSGEQVRNALAERAGRARTRRSAGSQNPNRWRSRRRPSTLRCRRWRYNL